MSRRRSSRQDSLELLLDTICNTFGGVLFIAILVVLLLQQTGGGPDIPAPASASPVELQLLAIRMEAVAADLARLRQNRDSQQAVVQSFAPAAIREQIVRRHAVTVEQEALQSVVDQLLTENASLAGQVETLAVENGEVHVSLEAALARRKQAQSDLERDRQSRVEEVRMPVVRPAGGVESFKCGAELFCIARFALDGSDEDARDLVRAFAEEAAVDFGVLLARVADQDEAALRKGGHDRFDGGVFVRLLWRPSQLAGRVSDAKPLQVERTGGIAFSPQELGQRSILKLSHPDRCGRRSAAHSHTGFLCPMMLKRHPWASKTRPTLHRTRRPCFPDDCL